MVKFVQVQETEILIAMSFWALGGPICSTIGLLLSGLIATGSDKKLVSVSTAIVDGLDFGAANMLLLGVTTVMNVFMYAYVRYALRLQMKDIPNIFPILFLTSYIAQMVFYGCPHVKVHISPYDYGIHLISFEIFMIGEIAWMMYYSQWMKNTGGRACFVAALALAGVLLVVSWVLAAVSSEEHAAPAEWSCAGIVIACHGLVVFMCERDKVMKLNSNGFSQHVSQTPQEYEAL